MTDPSTGVNTSLKATNIINLTNLQLYKIFWTTLLPAITDIPVLVSRLFQKPCPTPYHWIKYQYSLLRAQIITAPYNSRR